LTRSRVLLYAAEETITAGAPSTLALGYWAVLAALLVALAAAAWRIREQQRTQRQPEPLSVHGGA
jgi:hypothetical protein